MNLTKRQISFLDTFSHKDFILNEHKKEDYLYIFDNYDKIIPFINDWKILDLGCWTWFVLKYYFTFSWKNITLYWVDKNSDSISLAKKNNPNFEANFLCEDYFNYDYSHIDFATIILNIYIFEDKKTFINYINILLNIHDAIIDSTILIIYCDHDWFFSRKNLFLKGLLTIISKKFVILKNHKNFLVLKK